MVVGNKLHIILKVDRFINHQMDPYLMKQVAVEFMNRFAEARPTKILTVEASGIAPAVMLGYMTELPVAERLYADYQP